MIEYMKIVQSSLANIYATKVNGKKTVTNLEKKCYDSITSNIKKVLGPLAAVTNPDVNAALLTVLNAVSK